MNGVSDPHADAARAEVCSVSSQPFIPWTFGFAALLFFGGCVRILARCTNDDMPS
jgi:hypothetical protein